MNDVLKEISVTLEELETLDNVLEMAVSMEEQGREFYLEKASTIKSVETIGLYNYLVREESRHADYLRQYRKDKTERGHYELIDGFLEESTQFRMQT
jgi:rubrerythrin